MPIAVVIPTLNAEATLTRTLDSLAEARHGGAVAAVVVADGGSTDATPEVARALGAAVVASPRGRGRQLAEGARAALALDDDTDWLLFLHADTRLARGWLAAAEPFMADPEAAGKAGFFRLAYDGGDPRAARIARLASWRARILGLPYGDQGLLIHRDLYEAVGGFRPLELMEDVDLVRRLGRRRLAEIPAEAVTSPERYARVGGWAGWWLLPARNVCLMILFRLGVPPGMLRRLYR